MIPKQIFFNFALADDFGGKPFGLVHFLAIKSAQVINQCPVFLYHEFQPENNRYWEMSKQFCAHVKCRVPRTIFGNHLNHVAYRSDVFRLSLMHRFGGIHLDLDTLCIRPFDPLLKHSFVMGKQEDGGRNFALCNAVILGEPRTEFGWRWLQEYRRYNPEWGQMGVHTPYRLAIEHPELITVLPKEAFFQYNWTLPELKMMHGEVAALDASFVLHLWQQVSYENFLIPLTEENIKTRDSTYNCLARNFL